MALNIKMKIAKGVIAVCSRQERFKPISSIDVPLIREPRYGADVAQPAERPDLLHLDRITGRHES